MRAASLVPALLAAACATVVKDLPRDEPVAADAALLAGSLEFSRLQLRSSEGRLYVVRPEGTAFLVAVPPGTYTVEAFGVFRPAYDTLTLEAAAGRARYVGSFRPARDEHGELRVVVRDEMDAVAGALRERYGEREIERALVQSSLEPLAGDALVVAVYRPESYPYPYYGGYWCYGWYHRPFHHRPPPRRRARRR